MTGYELKDIVVNVAASTESGKLSDTHTVNVGRGERGIMGLRREMELLDVLKLCNGLVRHFYVSSITEMGMIFRYLALGPSTFKSMIFRPLCEFLSIGFERLAVDIFHNSAARALDAFAMVLAHFHI